MVGTRALAIGACSLVLTGCGFGRLENLSGGPSDRGDSGGDAATMDARPDVRTSDAINDVPDTSLDAADEAFPDAVTAEHAEADADDADCDRCGVPSCNDGVRNGGETDVDCGGPCTGKCALGKGCSAKSDCASGDCVLGVCTDCSTGTCPSRTFMVVRVGDGSTPLTNSSQAVFVERRSFGAAPPLATIPLPTAVMGANQPFTLAGLTTRDGALSLSTDEHYVSLLGYGAPLGAPSISNSSSVYRVVARIDAQHVVDTSTVLTSAFSGNNARSATSLDGSAFWVGGASSTSGGVHYIAFGTMGGTRILDVPTSVRSVVVYGGRLFGASGDTPYSGVFQIGAGLPTTGGQIASMLPGMPTTGQSPCSFVVLDRNDAVPGPDTAYVADDRAPAVGGGIQKWTFDGNMWHLIATFNHDATGATLPVGMRGLAGLATGPSVTLVATSAETSVNRIFMYTDDGSSLNPTPSLLGTASANTAYRGVAIAP
jgi:hypothetical protein